MRMRFFTDEALDGDEDAWSATQNAYAMHIDTLRPRLRAEAIRLATDPTVNLADGFVREFEVSESAGRIRLVVVRGITQISLRFKDAEVVPPNLYLLACALGAEYHAGHFGRVLTTIREQEVDLHDDVRILLRLRLNPFHTVGVAFADLDPIEVGKHPEAVRTAGRFLRAD